MAVNIAQRLDMPLPHIYVTQSPVMNAFASGLTLPGNVVFHSALLEAMSEAEIATIMAHESGHIKCRHVVYMGPAAVVHGHPGQLDVRHSAPDDLLLL